MLAACASRHRWPGSSSQTGGARPNGSRPSTFGHAARHRPVSCRAAARPPRAASSPCRGSARSLSIAKASRERPLQSCSTSTTTDDPVHGQQELALFNAHYDCTCFQPIHIFDGLSGKPVLSLLRPGKRPSGEEVAKVLRHVIARIRRHWPHVEILVRARPVKRQRVPKRSRSCRRQPGGHRMSAPPLGLPHDEKG
jgi:hypothetical protein